MRNIFFKVAVGLCALTSSGVYAENNTFTTFAPKPAYPQNQLTRPINLEAPLPPMMPLDSTAIAALNSIDVISMSAQFCTLRYSAGTGIKTALLSNGSSIVIGGRSYKVKIMTDLQQTPTVQLLEKNQVAWEGVLSSIKANFIESPNTPLITVNTPVPLTAGFGVGQKAPNQAAGQSAQPVTPAVR